MTRKSCPWCDNTGQFFYDNGGYIKCKHPPRVTIRALPGATFRTTKFEVVEGATPGRNTLPTWKPPADIGKAFAKAIRRPVPGLGDVT